MTTTAFPHSLPEAGESILIASRFTFKATSASASSPAANVRAGGGAGSVVSNHGPLRISCTTD